MKRNRKREIGREDCASISRAKDKRGEKRKAQLGQTCHGRQTTVHEGHDAGASETGELYILAGRAAARSRGNVAPRFNLLKRPSRGLFTDEQRSDHCTVTIASNEHRYTLFTRRAQSLREGVQSYTPSPSLCRR